ncbi:tyrosine-type recombinase/integrase [Burkholderia sp. BCC1988]|uniref:tyrosine-type recombinase/integrase n=1 Tax=Burkholderia sp. BCC1988 TaxID=2817443 RepID=UPI002AB116EA|nr:integrase arm-type DNA-binding domain-containing protein [Burkholderia sp. BCC1988]
MGAIHKLTAQQIKHAKPGYLGDGGGLWLQVSPAGTKSWVFRFTIGKRRREMGLGSVDTFTLVEARQKALACRRLVADGVDPIDQRIIERAAFKPAAPTFATCADKYIDANRAAWSNAKHADQWTNTLTTYAGPVFGHLPVDHVTTEKIIEAIGDLWATKTETATRVRQRIEAVLDWATVRGYRTGENPARWKGHMDKLLPKPSKVKRVEHHAALPYGDVAAFMATLAGAAGTATRCLEFTVLTACRTGESIGALWSEIDLDAAVWTIPAERMKAKRSHRVPLSDAAVRLLSTLPREQDNDHVFIGTRAGKGISNMSMLAVLKRLKRTDLTVHGFRSCFRDWAAERTQFPRELAEAALAHIVGSETERAYQRGDMFDRRRLMMQAWADFTASQPGQVFQIGEVRERAA